MRWRVTGPPTPSKKTNRDAVNLAIESDLCFSAAPLRQTPSLFLLARRTQGRKGFGDKKPVSRDPRPAPIIRAGQAEKQPLWRYLELIQVLAWRDVSVRYKQRSIGVAWSC
jgi:hypothetical protein